MKGITLSIVFSLLFSCHISANTLYVPNTYQSIQPAIDAANDGDTILVAPGTYTDIGGGLYIENKGIHIISEDGPEVTIIANICVCYDAGAWAFYISYVESSCTINGFSIVGHYEVYSPFGNDWETIAIYESANVTVSNNIFRNNYNSNIIELENTLSTTIESNVFYQNSYWQPDLHVQGGTIIEIIDNSSPIIQFNTFSENNSNFQIDLIAENSYPIIRNNIIVKNNGCGISSSVAPSNITVECNDVWNNSSGNYSGTLTDLTGINGNISVDPLFCGILHSYNFYLQEGSPCAESNVPEHCNGVRIGAYPANCAVDVQSESWGELKSKFKK